MLDLRFDVICQNIAMHQTTKNQASNDKYTFSFYDFLLKPQHIPSENFFKQNPLALSFFSRLSETQ